MVSEAQERLAGSIAGAGVWLRADILRRMESRDPFVDEIVEVFRSVHRSGISGYPDHYLNARQAAAVVQKSFGTTFWAFMRAHANPRAAARKADYLERLARAGALTLEREQRVALLEDLDRYVHVRILECLGMDEQTYAAECELSLFELAGASVLLDVQPVSLGGRTFEVEFVAVQGEDGHWKGEVRIRHDVRYTQKHFSYVRSSQGGARTPLLLPSQDVIASWHVDRFVEVKEGDDIEVFLSQQSIVRWHFEQGRFAVRSAEPSKGV